MAVAAVAAGDMALAGHPLSHLQAGHPRAQGKNLAYILMADGHGGLDVQLRPWVPIVDVHVGAADCGLMYFDENLSGAGLRHAHLPQLQSRSRGGLDQGVHHRHRYVLLINTLSRHCVSISRTIYRISRTLSRRSGNFFTRFFRGSTPGFPSPRCTSLP